MDRCSPVEMRKNLEVVEQFKRHGIDFVAVPVRDQQHKNELMAQGQQVLEDASDEPDDDPEREPCPVCFDRQCNGECMGDGLMGG